MGAPADGVKPIKAPERWESDNTIGWVSSYLAEQIFESAFCSVQKLAIDETILKGFSNRN
jgi:hypothetical protein